MEKVKQMLRDVKPPVIRGILTLHSHPRVLERHAGPSPSIASLISSLSVQCDAPFKLLLKVSTTISKRAPSMESCSTAVCVRFTILKKIRARAPPNGTRRSSTHSILRRTLISTLTCRSLLPALDSKTRVQNLSGTGSPEIRGILETKIV